MDKSSLAIGVFDSGMGGLTVLKALREALPNESFIYLGDMARLPYGTKSPETVRAYAEQLTRVLVDRGIKALVIACNTATTAALDYLQSILPDLPVIGVVEPGAMAAIAATKNQKILILATETTIAAKTYPQYIKAHLPEAQIKDQACSVLVALAEAGMVDNDVAMAALSHYLNGYEEEDTIVLGCTHFPVFRKSLATLLPPSVTIVDSAHSTSAVLKDILTAKGILASTAQPTLQYLVTDSVERFRTVGSVFLDMPLNAADIELIDPGMRIPT